MDEKDIITARLNIMGMAVSLTQGIPTNNRETKLNSLHHIYDDIHGVVFSQTGEGKNHTPAVKTVQTVGTRN